MGEKVSFGESKYWFELKQSLEKLESNKDFKKLILEGYLKDKALASVSLLARQDIKSNGKRPNVMEDLVAISTLQDYFEMVKVLGTHYEAPNPLTENEEGK